MKTPRIRRLLLATLPVLAVFCFLPQELRPARFVRGDLNADGGCNLGDIVTLLFVLFTDKVALSCEDAADFNDDEKINLVDLVEYLRWKFADGRPPEAPHPGCGVDRTSGKDGPGDLGCADFGLCTNEAPAGDAGKDQFVPPGATVFLDGSRSYDPDADPITYTWGQSLGPPVVLDDDDTVKPHFVAPDEETVLGFWLVVSDGELESRPSETRVTVTLTMPEPVAVAEISPAQTIGGGSIILDGSQSYDPRGLPLVSYLWTQTEGPPVHLISDSVSTSFSAPYKLETFTLSFDLVVSNGEDESEPAHVSVTVDPAPSVELTRVSAEVPLEIPDNDPDGVVSAIDMEVSGLVLAAEADIQIAHAHSGDLRIEIRCPDAPVWHVLRDSTGEAGVDIDEALPVDACTGIRSDGRWSLRPSDLFEGVAGTLEGWSMTWTLVDVNHPPTANAGEDQAVPSEGLVTLDGTRSFDPDGFPIVYVWSQRDGPVVNLDGPDTDAPSFFAPEVSEETVLVFQLLVTDMKFVSAPDTVRVVVHPIPVTCGDGTCGDGEGLHNCWADCRWDLVVVVEGSIAGELEGSLDEYLADIDGAGWRGYVHPWSGGTAEDLAALIAREYEERGIRGAWLIGDLPAAWYEMGPPEQFPFDIFLMDPGASWTDQDGDGMYDGHSRLYTDLFTARLKGTVAEIQGYLAKVHEYRMNGSLTDGSALVFMDDDWSWLRFGTDYMGLEDLYRDVERVSDKSATTLETYLDRLTGRGAEYVYQAIHSSASQLSIRHDPLNGPGSGGTITNEDIAAYNFKGSFFFLNDCSASRFTFPWPCVGEAYVLWTDTGLASLGPTKISGVPDPRIFHSRLAAGDTWGEAFRRWYNGHGRTNDNINLGTVLMGDPLLAIEGDAGGIRSLAAGGETPFLSDEDIERMSEILRERARELKLDTFEEYRARNPQFFLGSER